MRRDEMRPKKSTSRFVVLARVGTTLFAYTLATKSGRQVNSDSEANEPVLELNQSSWSVEIMKKSRNGKQVKSKSEKDLLPEYQFDYEKARPNRFAERLKPGSLAVVLDPDIAAVFSTPESVNAVLRALIATIATMPQTKSG